MTEVKESPANSMLHRLNNWTQKHWQNSPFGVLGFFISLVILALTIANYVRQGDRWRSDDDSKTKAVLMIQPYLTSGGYRWGSTLFISNEPMRLEQVQVLSPKDAVIGILDTEGATSSLDYKVKAVGKLIKIAGNRGISRENIGQSTLDYRGGTDLAVKLSNTPHDAGEFVEVELSLRKLENGEVIKKRATGPMPAVVEQTPVQH
jgi:hypothetical protein